MMEVLGESRTSSVLEITVGVMVSCYSVVELDEPGQRMTAVLGESSTSNAPEIMVGVIVTY